MAAAWLTITLGGCQSGAGDLTKLLPEFGKFFGGGGKGGKGGSGLPGGLEGILGTLGKGLGSGSLPLPGLGSQTKGIGGGSILDKFPLKIPKTGASGSKF